MTQTTFIGRKAELQRLEEFLKKAASGQLQVVFIAGEAGAGKSTLVEKFIHDEEELDPHARCLHRRVQRTHRLGRSVPSLSPVIDITDHES